MSALDGLRFQLYRLTHPREMEDEAGEEIAFHLAQEQRLQHTSTAAARRRFGNITYYKEEMRRMGGHWLLDALVQDVRFAARTFRRTPVFSLIAVLTLAIGIGANTAIFSAVNTLLFRPLPYRDPERLMSVALTAPAPAPGGMRRDLQLSYPAFRVFRDGQHVFEDLTAWSPSKFTIRVDNDARRISGEFIDSHYFAVLGATPQLGRAFEVNDDRREARHVVVLSDVLWRQLFNADPMVRGKTLDVDGTEFEVVGVAPRGFSGLSGQAQFWIPLFSPPLVWANMVDNPYDYYHHIIGRLADGISPEHAAAEVQTLGARVDAAFPVRNGRVHLGAVARELDALRVDGRIRRTLFILFAAVGLVLLIACANVANLFLVRATGRSREIATRLALGASRLRIVRQLLVESMLVASVGGLVGIGVAGMGVRFLSNVQIAAVLRLQNPGGLGAMDIAPIHLDRSALLFAAVLVLGTGIVFGLVPALHATRSSLSRAMREGTTLRGGKRKLTGRNALVVVEVALAVVLLAGAGLMVRSLGHLLGVRPGFDSSNVLTMRVNRAPAWSRDSISRFYDVAMKRLSAVPGVTDVAMIDCSPLEGCSGTAVQLLDAPPAVQRLEFDAGAHWVTPGMFSLLNVPLIRGRTFTAADDMWSRKLVIVNETAARKFWPNQDPIGRPVRLNIDHYDTAYVVGVVGDVLFGTIDSLPRPDVYVSYYQAPISIRMMIFARTRDEAGRYEAPIRKALHEATPGFPVYDVATLEWRVAAALAYARICAILLSTFAALALALAAIGTFGVMSFLVAQRARELAVRSALGATRRTIVTLVVRQGLLLAVVGMSVGLVAALGVTRFLASLLYDVQPTDPVTLIGICVILLAAMLAATWIPARRAVTIPVAQVLRSD